jgi:hypothetical protein
VDIQRAADLYAQGWTLRQIGAELGLTATTVSHHLRCAGITMRRGGPPTHPASTQQILELRDRGLTWTEVAKPAAPEPEPTVDIEVARDVPAVSKDVEDAAKHIAISVHSAGGKLRSQLFPRRLREADEAAYLGHAVALQWLVVEGVQVRPGPVHPQPRTTTLIPN